MPKFPRGPPTQYITPAAPPYPTNVKQGVMNQPTQQEEDAAIQNLLNAVGTCPTGGPTGGRKRRGGAGKRGFSDVSETPDVPQPSTVPTAPAASTLPTPGFFSMGTAPKKGEPLAKRSRTATASVDFKDKAFAFGEAFRDLTGAAVAENALTLSGVAAVSIINPAAASQALAIIKMVSGGVLGCVTPNVVTAALIGAGLWKIVGPYISIGDVASLTGNKLKNLSDSIGNYLKQQETMSKKAKQMEYIKSLNSLHRVFVQRIEDIKNNNDSTEEAEASSLAALTNELKQIKTPADTSMEQGVGFNPAPPTGPLKAGRKTKKRSMKKFKKTRRGIRTPLFRY
jgi:hypothetical protein